MTARLVNGSLVYEATGRGARYGRSVFGNVLSRLNFGRNFWIPLGVGFIIVVAGGLVHMVQENIAATTIDSGFDLVRSNLVMDGIVGGPLGPVKHLVPSDGNNGFDVIVTTNGMKSSFNLVAELRLFTAYKVRDYNLLQQCVTKAAHWIKGLPDSYGLGKLERGELLYGSVARAMEVCEQEKLGCRYMQLTGGYDLTKGWVAGVPDTVRLSDIYRGGTMLGYLGNKIRSWNSSGSIGPKR
jgi:hypothetical protein